MSSRHSPALSFFLMVLVLSLCLGGIYITRPDPPRPMAPAPAPAPVSTRVMELKAVPNLIRGWGDLHAVRELSLVCEQAGMVAWLHPRLESGLQVAAGEELLRLDPIPFELAKARARATNDAAVASQAALKSRVLGARRALHTASEQESIAQRELTRMRQLEEQGDASISLLDQARQAMIAATGVRESAEYGLAEAENSLRASTASVAESAAGLAIANDALRRSVVRAPFAGEVGSVTVALGTWLIPGTPTLRLIDRTSLEAKILLSAEDCTAIKPGQGVSLETALSGFLHGEVIGVDPEIRMPNRSRMVVVRVDNSGLVVPAGAHAAAIVDAGTKSGLWLRPSEYTVTDGDLRVWVLNSTEDAVSARLLKLGRPIFEASGQTWLPVLSGLEAGDKIAIDNLGALSDGVGVSALN